jgi:hypothetical protein
VRMDALSGEVMIRNRPLPTYEAHDPARTSPLRCSGSIAPPTALSAQPFKADSGRKRKDELNHRRSLAIMLDTRSF